MSVYYRTQGFFIEKADQGESNQLFTIYTKDFGKLDTICRAVRKIKSKLRGGAELFYLSEVEFIQGKAYKTLTDSVLIERFPNIRGCFEKLVVARKISQALKRLVNGQEPDKEVWALLNEVFEKLDSQNSKFIYYYFLWNLFKILGYQPKLYQCALCLDKLRPEILYFGLAEGGVVCKKCFKETREVEKINAEAVKVLRLFVNRDWEILSRLKIDAGTQEFLEKVSENYLSEILNKN
ncbi:MAG: DNA repair protein RecO [Candidatus Nealsonbacteria bacterium]|nr:DNA repair protein RecO [Candidatus Nealsonbacteria bacterium]